MSLVLTYKRFIANEIKIFKKQKATVQQRKSPSQSRPREGNRAVRQAGQYAAIEGAQVKEGL